MAVDFKRDPILEANPKTYDAFLVLMAEFRIQMNKYKTGTHEYNYWRATIKELRVRAIEQNIDAYTLEIDTHQAVLAAKRKPEIDALEESIRVAHTKIKEAAGTPQYNAVLAEQTNVADAAKEAIRVINSEVQQGIPKEDLEFYRNMVKEAYVVKELVDLRHQRDTATTEEEREVLRARAEQLRMEGIAILQATNQNTEWQRDDLERRVWYLFLGRNIAPPRFGEPDTRSEEDKKTWDGHKALMDSAFNRFNTYDESGKNGLVPQDELWEQIKNKEKDYTKDIWRNRQYETFSGADMVVYFAFPGYKPIDVGLASLVSYSLYREKKQIRTVGAINTRGITKGPRTISGRLVMTVVREHFVEAIKREIPYMRTIRNMLMDELPPFDILVSFGNEYGAAATLVIHGVTFVDEQKTLTVEDLYTENIFTYLARDIDVMKTVFAKYTDEYDPMEWMSSSFIPDGSEILGDFYPKELELTQAAGLMENPEPFYGEISGWNATLYDLMYTGVDSGSLTIDASGNLVDNSKVDTTVKDDTKKEETGEWQGPPEPPKEAIDSEPGVKTHSANDTLWLTKDSQEKAFKAGVLFGGFFGNNWTETSIKYSADKTKERIWKLMDTDLGYMTDSHAKMRERMLDFDKSQRFKGDKTDLKFKFRIGDGGALGELPSQRVTGYKVMVTFEYIPPSKNTSGFNGSERSAGISENSLQVAVLGHWKSNLPWSDISKAMTATTASNYTDTKYKYWINTVSANKKDHNYVSKNEKVGQVDPTQREEYIKGKTINRDGTAYQFTSDAKGEFEVDLNKIIYIPSTINHLGVRKLLSFFDLPTGSRVVVKFTYVPNTPKNPTTKDGDLRYFYMLLHKNKPDTYNAKKSHPFFKESLGTGAFSTFNPFHLAIWNLYNAPDKKK